MYTVTSSIFEPSEDYIFNLDDKMIFVLAKEMIESWRNKVKGDLRDWSSVWDERPELERDLSRANKLLEKLDFKEAVDLIDELNSLSEDHRLL